MEGARGVAQEQKGSPGEFKEIEGLIQLLGRPEPVSVRLRWGDWNVANGGYKWCLKFFDDMYALLGEDKFKVTNIKTTSSESATVTAERVGKSYGAREYIFVSKSKLPDDFMLKFGGVSREPLSSLMKHGQE